MHILNNLENENVKAQEIYKLNCGTIIENKTVRHHSQLLRDIKDEINFQTNSTEILSITNDIVDNNLFHNFFVKYGITGYIGKISVPLYLSEEEIEDILINNYDGIDDEHFESLFLSCLIYGEDEVNYNNNKLQAISDIQSNLNALKEKLQELDLHEQSEFLNNSEKRRQILKKVFKLHANKGEEYIY
ncbi:hypothetical protein [Photobacterium kishitanii]|uniref:Uncharacterized protein n=1 Tax=Photobacterium kishitanii TaxID=318456 RepID=A0A2T3KMH4_9GAMM|nr:hypothetical protein [Photobacterium kishitanii]PSV01003.1 hypothetical protein C9J27_02965 [Photobacterium kishitanii]